MTSSDVETHSKPIIMVDSFEQQTPHLRSLKVCRAMLMHLHMNIGPVAERINKRSDRLRDKVIYMSMYKV